MGVGIDAVERELSAVGAAVGEHVLDVTRDIWQVLTSDIPELRGDDTVQKLLDASIEENVTLVHVFEHGLGRRTSTPRSRRWSTRGAWPSAVFPPSP
jgi:hypothetical protein